VIEVVFPNRERTSSIWCVALRTEGFSFANLICVFATLSVKSQSEESSGVEITVFLVTWVPIWKALIIEAGEIRELFAPDPVWIPGIMRVRIWTRLRRCWSWLRSHSSTGRCLE
jgi:hypothetical protein